MSSQIGRNQKCPCGSGKKYKQCCLGKKQSSATHSAPSGWYEEGHVDELSNRALSLTNEGRFAEAEAVCRQLEARYPDQIDHLDRLGELREAQGRFREAAVLYRRCGKFARTHPGFDEDSVQWYDARACEVETRA